MGHHPGLVREMAARHSRGTSRVVGRFCACEKLVIRRPKRSSTTGRPTTRLEYKTSKGPSMSETGPFWSLFGLGRVQPKSRGLVSRAAPSYESSQARTRLLAFRKLISMSIDQAVYKQPALSARSRLRKVGHLRFPPAQHGLRERSVNVREVRDVERPMDRIAGRRHS
jgi:hypothetical protein